MKAKQLILAASCSALAFAAAPQARADDGITIGMAVAMSGWMEAYDGEATKMAQLWVDQQNAKGGLLGKPIKVVSGDTKTDRVEGAKVGQALIQQGANLLLVSADYDYGAPAGLQAQKAGVISVFMGRLGSEGGRRRGRPAVVHSQQCRPARRRRDGRLGHEKERAQEGLHAH